MLIFAIDFPRMLEFYRDRLGLRVNYASDMFAELAGAGDVGISLHAGRAPSGKPDGDMMVEFLVTDIDDVVRQLESKGVQVEPVRQESFGKITHFSDPEGHRIGLEQPRRK